MRDLSITNTIIITCICIALGMLLSGCTNGKKNASTPLPNENVTYEKGADFIGVVKKVDSSTERIIFYDTLLEGEESYQYSGSTQVLSKNGRDMSIDEIELGEVYDVFIEKDTDTIEKVVENGDIITEESVKVSFDSDEKQISTGDMTYAYTDNLVAISNGKLIDPLEITNNDEVLFRGVKGKAYSLVVTRGHGYIKPTKYSDFLGGIVTVKGEAVLRVSKDMLLLVPEGEQTISMTKGGLSALATINVKRGEISQVNMAKYQNTFPDIANVKFEIEPAGAELYIDGKLTDYSSKVPLKYGSHMVKVSLEGYNDYKANINILDSGPTIKINLSTSTSEVDSGEKNESKSSSSKSSSDSKSGDDTESEKVDEDHKISVSEPVGASVYVNGTYKGVVPCNFPKVLGKITLTLSMTGLKTKSYSLQITDDSKDVSWSFPELEQN